MRHGFTLNFKHKGATSAGTRPLSPQIAGDLGARLLGLLLGALRHPRHRQFPRACCQTQQAQEAAAGVARPPASQLAAASQATLDARISESPSAFRAGDPSVTPLAVFNARSTWRRVLGAVRHAGGPGRRLSPVAGRWRYRAVADDRGRSPHCALATARATPTRLGEALCQRSGCQTRSATIARQYPVSR